MARRSGAHPYIPNLAPKVKAEMLEELGLKSTEDLFRSIPDHLRLTSPMDLPEPVESEFALRKRVQGVMQKNKSCEDYLSFLGAGCYQHYVPAVCDEVNQRGEFLTAYTSDTYEDHGRFQALFEYASMMGELLNMEVVSFPTYDWAQAAASSMRMACRATGRTRVLASRNINPERVAMFKNYLKPEVTLELVEIDPATGGLDLTALRRALENGAPVAGVYFENPCYLGVIEQHGAQISEMAHGHGALSLVGVDPVTLGVLTPPADYGADIVSGDLQTLGIHMQYGGGLGGFVASHDEYRIVMEFPTRLVGVTPTKEPGEYGFGEVAFARTAFIEREHGKEYVGTGTALWGITAGVYLALMGPQGMAELGEGIMQRAGYAIKQLSALPGVSAGLRGAPHFKEFVVSFRTGQTVAAINEALRERFGILGGKDVSAEFPELGQAALYCVTEVHTKQDMDRLVFALREVTK